MKRLVRLACGLVTAAALGSAVLTGCGGGGSASSSDGTIKVLSWAPIASPTVAKPQMKTAAEARVKAINDAGGINGHRVELIFCDNNYDPNTEAGCARQAVQEKVAAVVAPLVSFPGTFSILERAKIPMIGSPGFTPQEMASPIAYPLAGGIPAWYAGVIAQLKQSGARTLGLITCNSPVCNYGASVVKDVVKQAGMQLAGEVSVPPAVPDPSAAVAQALAAKPDGLVLTTFTNDIPKFVQAARRGGYSGQIGSFSGFVTPAVIKALGADANGMLLTAQVKPTTLTGDPAIAQFTREMNAVDASAEKDESAVLAWGGFELFEQLAKRLGTVDAASVTAAMNNLSDPIDTGVTAPYSTAGKSTPVASAPRLFNPTVYLTKVANGTMVPVQDTPVNPFTVLAGS